jgi:outer membrane protein OmpA-like peptidoglycan-associated protein
MLYYKSLHVVLQKTIAVMLVLMLLQNAWGQTQYGIIAGAGKTSLYKFISSPDDYNRYASSGSFWAGITVNKPIIPNSIYLFSSAVYNKKGYKYLMQNETGAANTIKDSAYNQAINYADINISLRKKMLFAEESLNSFFVGTGPVVSILAGGKEKIQVNYFGNTMPAVNSNNSKLVAGNGPGKYKTPFLSWNITAGIEINKFSAGFTATIPIGNYYQDVQHEVKYKVKTFGINLGYTLYTHQKREKKEKPEPVIPEKPVPSIKTDSLADADQDGIADVKDKCPNKKGTLKYLGCPVPDTDADGINDDEDKCITIAGIAANNGCPAIKDSIKTDSTCYTVYFEPGKNILRSEAFATLNIVVKQLKANPKLVAVFTGHSDKVGSEEANMNRSSLRATTCADYVASFYLDKSKLTVIAMGNKNPAADLTDPLVQWKNRRVEICVFEKKQ